jgi:hypothetical protein
LQHIYGGRFEDDGCKKSVLFDVKAVLSEGKAELLAVETELPDE